MTTDHDVSENERGRRLRRPLRRETLADSAYEQIRRAILQGDLEDGTVLKQVELARDLEVSTVPVREALRRLQAEQLLVARPYQRYAVRALTATQVEEYLAIRAALEALTVTRLLEQPDEIIELHLDAAVVLKAQLRADLDEEGWFEADRAFHRSFAGTDSVTGEMVDDIQHKLRRYCRDDTSASREHALRDHDDLLQALRDRNGARACAILHRHVRALVKDAHGGRG